ncbi:hypothetical protein ACWC09_51485 [Streptomyces sp. NPDC001617]
MGKLPWRPLPYDFGQPFDLVKVFGSRVEEQFVDAQASYCLTTLSSTVPREQPTSCMVLTAAEPA